MHRLAAILRHDPVAPLLASGDEAIAYFTRRDILEEATGPITPIWGLPGAKRALKGQQPDGSWKGRPLLETWRQLRHRSAGKSREERLWITLAICRVMKRFCF